MKGLVLTRRKGQGFTIGPEITVTFIETKTGRVQVRICAPISLKVESFDQPLEEPVDQRQHHQVQG